MGGHGFQGEFTYAAYDISWTPTNEGSKHFLISLLGNLCKCLVQKIQVPIAY